MRDSAYHREGAVVWFTGLSGAGKTTLAQGVASRLGRRVTVLDGDEVRTHLSAGLGFSPQDRATNVLRVGWVAANIAYHGGLVLCALISPAEDVRDQVRQLVESHHGRFVLVHVSTPLEVCAQRDVKGHYARARSGELSNFTGVGADYEVPADPDLSISTEGSIEQTVDQVLAVLLERGILDAEDIV